MAAFSSWVQTTTTERKYWSLDLPTNATEVSKVLSSINQFVNARDMNYYDDTVIVEADEEKLFFYIKMSEHDEKKHQ